MTAITNFRTTQFAGLAPAKGTYEQAADTLIYGGTIVTVDGSDRADVVTAGQHAAGIAVATSDNRTTAPEGGGAGAINCEVMFGVFGLEYTGSAPGPGDLVYVVDNQTVSLDSSGDTRGIAGYCTELRNGLCWTLMSPHVMGEAPTAAAEAALLDDLQTDVTTERRVIPVTAFTLAAGAPLVAFSDGVNDGLATDEGIMYRWNVSSTTPIWTTIPLPDYIDTDEDIVVQLLLSREGAADTDVVATVGAYLQATGDTYDADADAGGDTAAIDGATKVVHEKPVTIASADVPSDVKALSLSVEPSSDLDSDDLNLHGVVIEFSRALTS